MSEYYTPKKEEFIKGFKYEIYHKISGSNKMIKTNEKDAYGWVEYEFELDDLESISLEERLESGEIRAKK